MIGIPRDAAGSVACGRSGLPLLAICPIGHNRLVAFRLLKTSETDRTPLYGRPLKCKVCGSREVTLFAIVRQSGHRVPHRQQADDGDREQTDPPPPEPAEVALSLQFVEELS
jgi:hypothetical protein